MELAKANFFDGVVICNSIGKCTNIGTECAP